MDNTDDSLVDDFNFLQSFFKEVKYVGTGKVNILIDDQEDSVYVQTEIMKGSNLNCFSDLDTDFNDLEQATEFVINSLLSSGYAGDIKISIPTANIKDDNFIVITFTDANKIAK